MRTFSRWMALAVLVCGPAAYADRNDFTQITKLGNPSAYSNSNQTEFSKGFNEEANGNFRAFARTFAAVMTSVNLMPPETLGHAGFSVNAELSVIGLPSSVILPTERPQTDSLLLPSVHIRKGLPFSLELGARVGWIDRSSMYAATGELKWAVNEGFTWLPDVGVRAHVTRLMGNRDFDLTAAGLDVGVGKQFPLGGMITLTPYGGLDLVGVMASSETIDFDQSRTLNSTLNPTNQYAGLDNTSVYEPVTLGKNINTRLYGGVRFIGGALQLGAEFSLSSQGKIAVTHTEQNSDKTVTTTTKDRALPTVAAFNVTMGLDF
ncbi:hypothetical protein [Vitiosangium sp. GDMCC 1.1324]|uniref:hypothetical protein n=1 Tax=Vitiosangium sp. (strain GDMCC 1.1324) TaxID=2138576 RepID=UPI000D3CBC2F|nr:hypothetical protein [Vitiosangium sp. GDMCC 1.1324]PTL78572.1 hypothetical protein DAT35_39315 [Vitiosangium sp. GDMCC 1.1324]